MRAGRPHQRLDEHAGAAAAAVAGCGGAERVETGHVASVGYDFTQAFVYGLDLILDALQQRRDTTDEK